MKEKYLKFLKLLPVLTCVFIAIFGFISSPEKTAQGIKDGMLLLRETVIPSLFPFMVLSSFICSLPALTDFIKIFEPISQFLFKTNAIGLLPFALGAIGGYPVGAKVISDFYTQNKLTKNEAERLFYWCVNPSPAFTITAVGTFLLSNFKSGLLLYISLITSAILIGITLRFLSNGQECSFFIDESPPVSKSNIFVSSVASGGEAMISVCGWVLTFSALSSLLDIFIENKDVLIFLKSISEVTIGCKSCAAQQLSLPIISALLGFGGFAVIFQVSPYLEKCGVKLKNFICWKIVNSALSAFICTQLIKIFPDAYTVFKVVEINNTPFSLSNNIATALTLIFMCLLLILELDNKRKVC